MEILRNNRKHVLFAVLNSTTLLKLYVIKSNVKILNSTTALEGNVCLTTYENFL